MKRKIIKIDEKLCNGCGNCIPNCPEGAIQMIDNKARLISDLFCDGLGACLGHCPEGAILVEEREAEPYDEKQVMENIIKQGPNVVKAHLEHLNDHGEKEFLKIAKEVLKEKNMEVESKEETKVYSGCPGSRAMDFSGNKTSSGDESGKRVSQLRQWPIQLHLISPNAPYFKDKDVLLSADCVAHSVGDFHKDYLKGKQLLIGCPKLDDSLEVYIDKITALIDHSNINTLSVMIMEVPCCGGLLSVAQQAVNNAKRKIPVKSIVVGIKGNILKEDWL